MWITFRTHLRSQHSRLRFEIDVRLSRCLMYFGNHSSQRLLVMWLARRANVECWIFSAIVILDQEKPERCGLLTIRPSWPRLELNLHGRRYVHRSQWTETVKVRYTVHISTLMSTECVVLIAKPSDKNSIVSVGYFLSTLTASWQYSAFTGTPP